MHPHLDIDKTGVSLSALCLVHCLSTPFLLSFYPVYNEIVNETLFHAVLGPALLAIAAFAFYRGYRRHRQVRVVVSGALGIAFLFAGLLFPHTILLPHFSAQATLSIVGSIFLITAHFWNIRYCRCQPV